MLEKLPPNHQFTHPPLLLRKIPKLGRFISATTFTTLKKMRKDYFLHLKRATDGISQYSLLISQMGIWGPGKRKLFLLLLMSQNQRPNSLIVFIVFCLLDTKIIHVNSKHFASSKIYKRANNSMKRYSTSELVREMQVKTTMNYHLTSIRMANKKRNENNKCWQRCGQIGTYVRCWWDENTMANSMLVP